MDNSPESGEKQKPSGEDTTLMIPWETNTEIAALVCDTTNERPPENLNTWPVCLLQSSKSF